MHNPIISIYLLCYFQVHFKNNHSLNYLFLKIANFISKSMFNFIYLYRKQVIFGGNFESNN